MQRCVLYHSFLLIWPVSSNYIRNSNLDTFLLQGQFRNRAIRPRSYWRPCTGTFWAWTSSSVKYRSLWGTLTCTRSPKANGTRSNASPVKLKPIIEANWRCARLSRSSPPRARTTWDRLKTWLLPRRTKTKALWLRWRGRVPKWVDRLWICPAK